MLKLILCLVFLIPLCFSWELVQISLFLLSFLVSILIGHDFLFRFLGFGLGIDYLSYVLILLRFWITRLVLFASHKVYKQNDFIFIFLLINILLLFFLVFTFSCLDYLSFYVRFEASLIPTLILILGWGYQPERIQAGVYFLFYTIFASLPLLVSILFIYYYFGTVRINLNGVLIESSLSIYLWSEKNTFAFFGRAIQNV